MSSSQFILPGKLDSYLATLNRLYERNAQPLLRSIVINGKVSVQEGWERDNWNGGTYGHALTLTVPEDIFLDAVEMKADLQSRIAQDINKLDNTPNEHLSEVFIEMEAPHDDRWREQTGLTKIKTSQPSVALEQLERIWGRGKVRVFLSHKSNVKAELSKLKIELEKCGLAAFVAHDDIEPTEEWHHEIERALFSMDALVALLTADYHDSDWTDQEVGVAIGRGVPLLLVRVGRDPYGLMGKSQGLGGCTLSDPRPLSERIFQILYKKLPDRTRLFDAAVDGYRRSISWEDSGRRVRTLLSQFETLSSEQVSQVLDAYRSSQENRQSFSGRDILMPLLKKWTGRDYELTSDGDLERSVDPNDIPF